MQNNSKSDRKFIELKYRIAWYAGAVFSFFLYFSGIVALYIYVRRKCLKRYARIVLMYHRIADSDDAPDITVSIKNFESQIIYLKRNFHIASLDEIVDGYINNTPLINDTVAITFDDGFKDNYTNAYPILREYNVPATIFILTELIGKDNGLSEEEIRVMHRDNITFGAHTMTHRPLSELIKEDAISEIKISKSALEKILNEKVKYFAYPYGGKGRDFTDESMKVVKESGFKAAFATDNGFITAKSEFFALNRIGIRNFPLFVLKVRVSGMFENKCISLLRKYVRI